MPSLHDLQWVTSHNSYTVSEKVTDAPFDLDAFYVAGFRGVELDIWKQSGSWTWSVNHTGGYRDDCRKLTDYLAAIRTAWQTPRADLLFIHIECKDRDVPAGFPAALDACLQRYLGESLLFKPADLTGPDGAWTEWPDLRSDALREKLIVVLTGEDGPKALYARRGRAAALCFPDYDPYRGGTQTVPHLVANTQYQDGYLGGLFGEWRCQQPSVLWRVYPDKDVRAGEWLQAWKPTGANMLALDFDGSDVTDHGQAFWPNPLCV